MKGMRVRSAAWVTTVGALLLLDAAGALAQFRPAGELVRGSGRGRRDSRVYAPGMRFPLENGPAYANSQVWGVGGARGPRGGQCDRRNYSFPWHDNYCESRRWRMPLCPAGRGHQGQDIRPATCRANVHPAVAVVDGTITHIGSYSVYLTGRDGTQYHYLHMSRVRVRRGQRVRCGDRLGMVSNVFRGTPTTIHLHFNIRQAMRRLGSVYVPPYTSLIQAYNRLGTGAACGGGGVDAGAPMDAGTTMPEPSGASCYSASRRMRVDSGACVQVSRAACGSASCGAYLCRNGRWTCPASVDSCSTILSAPGCGDPSPPMPRPRRGCRSATLGRLVSDGECVQVGPRRRGSEHAECASGCGVYQCRDGRWSCTTASSCGTLHENAACHPSGGASCRSSVLGRDVPSGECVQLPGAGCSADRCGWAVCADGKWACTSESACSSTVRHPHPTCGGSTPECSEFTSCVDCNHEAGCGWCESSGQCMPDAQRASCAQWQDEPSACIDCTAADCETCAASGFCSWCPGVGCFNDSRDPNPAGCTASPARNPGDCR